MTNKIQKHFILGDEWAYFKIYSGPKTLEKILLNEIANLAGVLYKEKVIDQFFFIRYADPDYHIRIRFHLTDITGLIRVIEKLNASLKYYIDNWLVWKLTADTYSREIKRYGEKTIHNAESLFCLNSMVIIHFLKETEDAGNDQIRWLWGIKCMDLLLEQFGFSLDNKVNFCKMISESYSREFNMNKSMRVQLDRKYRNEVKNISNIFYLENGKSVPGLNHISEYMKEAQPIIWSILQHSSAGNLEIPLNNIISSLIHMHFNRLFRTKQRMHELVIYYFMNKFYTSQAARLKYGGNKIAGQ